MYFFLIQLDHFDIIGHVVPDSNALVLFSSRHEYWLPSTHRERIYLSVMHRRSELVKINFGILESFKTLVNFTVLHNLLLAHGLMLRADAS